MHGMKTTFKTEDVLIANRTCLSLHKMMIRRGVIMVITAQINHRIGA